jgi:hypothetical protein
VSVVFIRWSHIIQHKSQEKDDTKPKTSDNETVKTKTSELRARELKLRKSEEQLKLKEKSMQEYRNEKIMLETRCQQLEARNFELEQTVKLFHLIKYNICEFGL